MATATRTNRKAMDVQQFYRELFAPLEAQLGSLDQDTLVAIIGFDAGGPLNFCTIGAGKSSDFVTYLSCELAVRPEQKPAKFGRYELLATCDDERWVRDILSEIGRMSLEATFDHGHTLDIGAWIDPDETLQGVLFEKLLAVEIDDESYGILRCIGVTRAELQFAQRHGTAALNARLQQAGVHPNTDTKRRSIL